MVLDLSKDHLVFDGLEDVLLNGNPIEGAYRNDIEEVEGSPTSGIYLQANVEWQIPTPPAFVSRIGQLIINAAGEVFTILALRKPVLNDYSGCECRLASIEEDLALANKVTRYPAVTVVDEEGARFVDNSAADAGFTDIACRIQPIADEVQDFMGKRGIFRTFHIFVASDIDLDYGDVLRDDTATQYSVQSWENRERIDELSLIVVHLME